MSPPATPRLCNAKPYTCSNAGTLVHACSRSKPVSIETFWPGSHQLHRIHTASAFQYGQRPQTGTLQYPQGRIAATGIKSKPQPMCTFGYVPEIKVDHMPSGYHVRIPGDDLIPHGLEHVMLAPKCKRTGHWPREYRIQACDEDDLLVLHDQCAGRNFAHPGSLSVQGQSAQGSVLHIHGGPSYRVVEYKIHPPPGPGLPS